MVRIIVGTLLDIAKGEIKDSVIDILSAKNRNESGRTLSPQGLFFLGPKYESKLKISSPFKENLKTLILKKLGRCVFL